MLLQLELRLSSLVSSYREGRKWVSVEYRRKEADTRWTEITVYMIEAPASHNLYVFIYISDVQKRRSAEEIVPITVERDPVSHLYTQETTEKLIDSLMRNSSASDKLFSLAIIHLTGLPSLRAKVGTVNAGVEVMYFGRYISILLDKDCIIGRYGDDSFFVFCPDSLSNEWMREKINDVVARVRKIQKSVEAENQLKIVCGIATERARRAGLAGMRSQALQICSSYRNTETDVVSSFEQYVDAFRISGKDLDDNSFVAVDVEELNRPLFGSEKELMSECMSAMLSADNYDVSANKVLAVLSRYYDAQRVYTLALLDDNSTATM